MNKSKYFIVREKYTGNYYVKQRLWPFGSKFMYKWTLDDDEYYEKAKISHDTLDAAKNYLASLRHKEKIKKPIYFEV